VGGKRGRTVGGHKSGCEEGEERGGTFLGSSPLFLDFTCATQKAIRGVGRLKLMARFHSRVKGKRKEVR